MAGPGLALAGTASGAFVSDACGAGLVLPVSALALTVAGAVVWVTGLSRERRDRLAVLVAAALTLLSMAALQQLLACTLGRDGIAIVELLQAGGLVLLFAALALGLVRGHRARAAAEGAPPAGERAVPGSPARAEPPLRFRAGPRGGAGRPRPAALASGGAQVAASAGAGAGAFARSASFCASPNELETSR